MDDMGGGEGRGMPIIGSARNTTGEQDSMFASAITAGERVMVFASAICATTAELRFLFASAKFGSRLYLLLWAPT